MIPWWDRLHEAMAELQWHPRDFFDLTPTQFLCLLHEKPPGTKEVRMETRDDFLVEMEERERLQAEEEARWTA